MSTITLSIPDDLKKQMDESREINWSEVARAAIKKKLNQLKILNTITKDSELTEEDAINISRSIKKGMRKRSDSGA